MLSFSTKTFRSEMYEYFFFTSWKWCFCSAWNIELPRFASSFPKNCHRAEYIKFGLANINWENYRIFQMLFFDDNERYYRTVYVTWRGQRTHRKGVMHLKRNVQRAVDNSHRVRQHLCVEVREHVHWKQLSVSNWKKRSHQLWMVLHHIVSVTW